MSLLNHSDALDPAGWRAGPVPLLVAYSGGLDSTALMHALAMRRDLGAAHPLRAIHVHHGLQTQADEWAHHCQASCAALGVALRVVHVEVAQSGAGGLEAAARKSRYAACQDAMSSGEVLVTAHHLDDQAETFLLRALRASGPDGLAAMRPWRTFGAGWHWRPLLDTPRARLLQHAREHGLQWIEDPSNASEAHERNFLRRQVMPLLRQRWAHADAALARSAALNGEACALLDHEDALALASSSTLDPQALSAAVLAALPAARQARVLRRWVTGLGLPPLPSNGAQRITGDLLPARVDARARFAWSGAVVRRWRDLLHAGPALGPLPEEWSAQWDGGSVLPLPGGGTLSLLGAPALQRACMVRARRGGERILLPGRTHSHALKHVLQELGVPPWERERLPLVCDRDGSVLAAGDLAIAAPLQQWLDERNARLQWRHAP